MAKADVRFAGVELYFDDLAKAKEFYSQVLGLNIAEEQSARFAKFESDAGFVCLERKGSESYPSQDKAVLFFEVEDLVELLQKLGRDRFVHIESGWAVMPDPEGHNVLLLQRNGRGGLRQLHEVQRA